MWFGALILVIPKYKFLFIFFYILINITLLYSSYDSKLKKLVESVRKTKDLSIMTIVVANFREIKSKQRTDFSYILEEDLRIKLLKTERFYIVAKDRIEDVLEELKFGYTGLTDEKNIKQFGKILQADAILTGEYYYADSFWGKKKIVISAKLIKTETLLTIWADKISIPEDNIPPNLLPYTEKQTVDRTSYTSEYNMSDFYKDTDFYLSFKFFNPENKRFKSLIETPSGFCIGIHIRNILGIEWETWNKSTLNVLDIKKITGMALELFLTYPFSLDDNFIIYAGGGGRFENIIINPDTTNTGNQTSFGNNGALLTAGIKYKISQKGLGLELNYSRTLFSNYTDYNMLKFGIVYNAKIGKN